MVTFSCKNDTKLENNVTVAVPRDLVHVAMFADNNDTGRQGSHRLNVEPWGASIKFVADLCLFVLYINYELQFGI